jgi:hypothetical protein
VWIDPDFNLREKVGPGHAALKILFYFHCVVKGEDLGLGPANMRDRTKPPSVPENQAARCRPDRRLPSISPTRF